MTFIAGAFAATYGGKYIGTTEDGFELTTSRIQEEIRVDAYRGHIDSVFQGIDMSIRFVLTEANMPAIADMLWNLDQDGDNLADDVLTGAGAVRTCVGDLISKFAFPLVLTPCSGTTAKSGFTGATEGSSLASITFSKVVLTPDPVTMKFASSLRRIPIAMHVLPAWASSPSQTPAGTFPNSGILQYYLTA